MHRLPHAVQAAHEPDAPLMRLAERMSLEVLVAAIAFMGSTGNPKVKMCVCASRQNGRYRYTTVSAWVRDHPTLEAWVLRRGDRYEVWLGQQSVAAIESANSPWWGRHTRRRTP